MTRPELIAVTPGVGAAGTPHALRDLPHPCTAGATPWTRENRPRRLSISACVLLAAWIQTAAAAPATKPFESDDALKPVTQIDRFVFARLERLGIQPANLCSDAVFLRRVYLDVIGTLPTEQEARDFLADESPAKRAALIDRLLKREEFADYWAMKWSDLLRVKAEFPINLWPNAAQAYHHWIRASVEENKPYDRFARELLTSSGSNFRTPPVNFYRAIQSREPQAIAQAVALTFMGVRPASWPKDRWAGMAAFFSQVGYKATAEWKEEIVFFNPSGTGEASTQPASHPASRPASQPAAVFPDGTQARLAADRDPREAFADWLITPTNPWFARNITNRVWFWLMGRGIIHEPDDIRPDNPPCNPELLTYLQCELWASHYDLKHIYRMILNSKAYQLSSVPKATRPEAAANFAQYPLRRLEAEVLIDALCQITGTTEKYSSPIPEPFTFIPESLRATELPDGSITSTFLEVFGRSPRDTGLELERNSRSTAGQKLHMLNSSHIQGKIEQSRKLQALAQGKSPREVVTSLYLTILSRFPTEEEQKIAEEYFRSGKVSPRQAATDVAWALVNSVEFQYRH
jgi:hypothetical protein